MSVYVTLRIDIAPYRLPILLRNGDVIDNDKIYRTIQIRDIESIDAITTLSNEMDTFNEDYNERCVIDRVMSEEEISEEV